MTGGVLIVLPVLSAAVPALAFTDSLAPVVLGALVWGAATAAQEAPATGRGRSRRAGPPGDGVFAAVVGVAALMEMSWSAL
ncbi:hypothetical protein [Streptomyces sp. NPDC058695]|uniref:hypothetical protein n=1 Tax=Streptomyces sp. NPDC058695 TaxID=3346604 RepID=UPI003650B030